MPNTHRLTIKYLLTVIIFFTLHTRAICQEGIQLPIKFPVQISSASNNIIYDNSWNHYHVDRGLFSDFADKHRIFYIPDNRVKIRSDGSFELPVGSALAKTFYFKSPSNKILETRILYKSENGWIPFHYIWENNTELRTVNNSTPVEKKIALNKRAVNYSIPSQGQCKQCHYKAYEGLVPLGFNAFQAKTDVSWLKKQISRWTDANKLRLSNIKNIARIYLHSNCAHCHSRTGIASNTGLFLDIWNNDKYSLGICKKPVSAGLSNFTKLMWDIKPGNSDASIMIYRMNSQIPSVQMPEIGQNEVDKDGVEIVRQWIDSMRETECNKKGNLNLWGDT